MDRKDVIIIGSVVTIVALVVVLVYVASVSTVSIQGSGAMKLIDIGAFADPQATVNVTNIDWGKPTPGSNATALVYIKNTGNSPMNVTYSVDNWAPTNAQNYMRISWDRTNQFNLTESQVVPITFTLQLHSNCTGITIFSMRIIVKGEG